MDERAAWAAGLAGLGAIVGSFLALVSVRWPAGEGVVAGRSRCRSCGQRLGVLDLVPLLSFLVLRGRCRTCGGAIDRRHPVIEALAAGVGLWAALRFGPGAEAMVAALLGWALVLLAALDLDHHWLPTALVALIGAGGVAQALAFTPAELVDRAIGAVVGFAVLTLIAAAYRATRGREGMGDGDPKLFAAIGAWVGCIGLASVLLWACVAAFSVVAGRVAASRRVRGDDRMAFGAYLALGLWLTWLYGPLGL